MFFLYSSDDFSKSHPISSHVSHHVRSARARSPTSGKSALHSRSHPGTARSRASEPGTARSRPSDAYASQLRSGARSPDKKSARSSQQVMYNDEQDDTLNNTLTPSGGSEENDLSSPPRKQMSVSLRDANNDSEMSVSSIGEEEQSPYDPMVSCCH